MKAYISYSINDSEQYVLTILAQKLREKGFSLTSGASQPFSFSSIDFQTEDEIKSSSLFIGLVTDAGRHTSPARVYLELQKAQEYNKPIILLVEDTAPLDMGIANFPNLIRFNRFSPHMAMEEVKHKIHLSQTQPQRENTLAWIMGGGAAALALISLLSTEK